MRLAAFGAYYEPFFFGLGIVSTGTTNFILPGRLKTKPDEEIWYVHGQGTHAGRPCLVLRTYPFRGGNTLFDELWIDPARESAVLRQIVYVNGQPIRDSDINYQESSRGWFPRNWTITDRLGNGKTLFWEQMEVKELTFDPAFEDADFKVEIKPGMRVLETEYGGSPDQVTADVPKIKEISFQTESNGSGNRDTGQDGALPGWVKYLLCLVVLFGVFMLSWIAIKRKRKAGSLH